MTSSNFVRKPFPRGCIEISPDAKAPACDVCGDTVVVGEALDPLSHEPFAWRCPEHWSEDELGGAKLRIHFESGRLRAAIASLIQESGAIPYIRDLDVDVAKDDAEWFKTHPHRRYRIRGITLKERDLTLRTANYTIVRFGPEHMARCLTAMKRIPPKHPIWTDADSANNGKLIDEVLERAMNHPPHSEPLDLDKIWRAVLQEQKIDQAVSEEAK